MSDTTKHKDQALVKKGDKNYERNNVRKDPKVTKENKATVIARVKALLSLD